MIKKIIEKINIEYGSKKMSPDGLFALLLLIPMLAYLEWCIQVNTHGVLYYFPLRYMQIFIISVSILIVSGVLFYNSKKNILLKLPLTIITCLSMTSTILLLIPIGLLLRTKEFLELITRFKFDETKPKIYMISLTISSLIISVYLGVGIVLYPLLGNELSGDYIFVLIFMVLFIFTFNTSTKLSYKIYIKTTKSYYLKKKLLHAYYQNYKEKNIVLFLLFLFTTLYVYSQKNPDGMLEASVGSITTIVLLDALIDKWKSRFHKTDTEYRFIELINMDIQFINIQIEQNNISTSNIKLIPHKYIDTMSKLNEVTSNRTYKKIFASYQSLIHNYHSHDDFIKTLYKLESTIINYMIKCN